MGCVYKWTNQVNQKSYIGKCHGDVNIRYKNHIRGTGSKLLKHAFNKYGIENFTFEILYDGILDAFLDDYEKDAIINHNAKVPQGYNLTDGGEGAPNPSEETRRKKSEAGKGRKLSNKTRKKNVGSPKRQNYICGTSSQIILKH